MTKFEEEHIKFNNEYGNCKSVNYHKAVRNHFKNWHSDEEYQELFDKYSNLNDNYEKEVIRSSKLESQIIELKSQLQQQALPVVPECVGEWYEEHKEDLEYAIYVFCGEFYRDSERSTRELTDFERWFDNENDNPIETLIRMKDGFTVEKSDKCMVKLGALYFKCWNDVDAVFIIDDQPGAYESAFVFKKREDAEKVAQLVGGRVVKN